jgi:hypothetical protein
MDDKEKINFDAVVNEDKACLAIVGRNHKIRNPICPDLIH